ncbi:unnamed protein product, partial [Iphiclides podalirius]
MVAILSLTHGAYISRMANVNRPRSPAVFRPGVMLHRPWSYQRIMPAASYRAPYVLYRGPMPHRYAMKPHNPNFRNVLMGGPWRTGRPPSPSTTEFRAAPAPVLQSHGGAIHTIPAPNLSLSEKPIVVAETSESSLNAESASEATKATYEVTEKYNEPSGYQAPVKIEPPTGFSKQSSLTTPELQQFVRNGAGFHQPPQYGASPLPQDAIRPQQFSMQGFTELTGHQDLLQTAAEGIIIPPSALYQNDPNFLQRLQSQLLQQYPSVEFIPYATDAQPQIQQTSPEPELFLLQDEVMTRQAPASFKPSEFHRNIVQRETQEGSVLSLVPHAFAPANVTEGTVGDTAPAVQNASDSIVSGAEPATTTVQHEVDATTEGQKTTIFYAQVGQSVGDAVAKGFYTAINDVRVAAALAPETSEGGSDNSSTTEQSETKVTESAESTRVSKNETNSHTNKQEDKEANNEVGTASSARLESRGDAPSVAYTLLRSPEEQSQNGDGNYAGQFVQAMVSEDREFNKENPSTPSRRPPLRLYAVPEKLDKAPKQGAVKAKIPPKSKLTFDNKTGEPVLRIYASYSENPLQKEVLLSKLSSIKHFKEGVVRKQDVDNWKAATSKTIDKNVPKDANQMTQFGLKLRSRSDDYIPLFEEYEE